MRKAFLVLGASLVLLLSCLPAFSQGGGTINGTISSQGGGPVANATVTVMDVSRGENRPLTTSASGLYSASGLTPGPYTIQVQAPGFKTMVHSGINLGVGSTLIVDFAMQPGAQTEKVVVNADVLPANANAVVENRAVSETPVNGRSFVALVENRNTGQTTLPGSGANARATNGMRTDQNNPLIDGVYDGDIDTGWQNVNGFGFQGGIDPDVILPLDAIQEINSNTYPKAEYGFHPGNTSNIGIKSGTNAIHGTAYGFGRDADTNTRNPFRPPPGSGLPGAGKTSYAMEQFGASIGGKILKDKLFYFANFERQRYNVGATSQINAASDGDFGIAGGPGASASLSVPDAIFDVYHNAANTTHIPVTQLSLNLLGCSALTPAAASTAASAAVIASFCGTGANAAPGSINVYNNYSNFTQNVPFGVNSVGGPDAGVGKVDYRINKQNSVNGEIYVGNATSLGWTKVSTQPWWLIDSKIRMYIIRGVWVYTPNSTMVNEARFGTDLVKESTVNSDCAGVNGSPNYTSTFGLNTGTPLANALGTCAFPFTTVTGFTGLSISPGAGPYTSQPRDYVGIDSMSWTHGKHVFKFGGEIHRGVFTGSGGGGTGPPIRGTLAFGTTAAWAKSGANSAATALEDLLTGTLTNGTAYVGSTTGITPQISANYYAGFIQDTYRFNRKLTIDLGVRYEYQPPYTQNADLLGGLNLNNPSGVGQEVNGKGLYNADTWKHNFGPRGAIAYDVFGNGKTVVRAVGNIMYAMTSYSGLSGMQNVPTGAVFYQPNGTTFTNPAGQNGITQGTVQTTAALPWNACLPGPNGIAGCSNTNNNTVFAPLLNGGLKCGDGLPTSSTASGTPATNPQPCAISVVNPNLYTPYITSWALNLQQTLNKNVSMILAYVGNHGTGIRQQLDINQPTPGLANTNTCPTGVSAAAVYCQNNIQARRPFTTNCAPGSIPTPTGTQYAIYAGTTSGPCLPWLSQVLEVANSDVSNFDALQFSLTLRNYHGLGGAVNYAWQHCLDMFSANENIWTILTNSLDPQQDYGTCTSGTPQRVTGNFNYAVPGKKAPLQLLTGWAVNGTATYLPQRYVPLKDTTNDLAGIGQGLTSVPGQSWNIFGSPRNINTFGLGSNISTIPCFSASTGSFAKSGCTLPTSTNVVVGGVSELGIGPGGVCTLDAASLDHGVPNGPNYQQLLNIGCYVDNGTVMIPPAQGTYGDMSRNCCLGPGFFQMDMSVTKTFGFMKEQRLKAQFRAEIFNIFNRVNYAAPVTNIGSAATLGQESSTPNTGAQIVTGTGSEREVQFGMKLIW